MLTGWGARGAVPGSGDPRFPGCTAALTAGPGGCRGRGRERDGAVEPRGCCGRETRVSHGRAGPLRAGPGPAAHLPAGAAAPPCSEPAAGHGRGGGDGGRSAALSASCGTGRALRSPSPGRLRCGRSPPSAFRRRATLRPRGPARPGGSAMSGPDQEVPRRFQELTFYRGYG